MAYSRSRRLQHPRSLPRLRLSPVGMPKRSLRLLRRGLRERKTKMSKHTDEIKLYRNVTVDKKMEFVEKVKKLTNEGLTKMVEHI
jgi:hypothetical protein